MDDIVLNIPILRTIYWVGEFFNDQMGKINPDLQDIYAVVEDGGHGKVILCLKNILGLEIGKLVISDCEWGTKLLFSYGPCPIHEIDPRIYWILCSPDRVINSNQVRKKFDTGSCMIVGEKYLEGELVEISFVDTTDRKWIIQSFDTVVLLLGDYLNRVSRYQILASDLDEVFENWKGFVRKKREQKQSAVVTEKISRIKELCPDISETSCQIIRLAYAEPPMTTDEIASKLCFCSVVVNNQISKVRAAIRQKLGDDEANKLLPDRRSERNHRMSAYPPSE